MVEIINAVVTLAVALGGGEVQDGWASQYETHQLMADTVEARQGWGQLPADVSGYDGFVAVESCNRIGDSIYLYRPGVGFEHFLVADCSGHASTTRWMRENGILVEVGRRTAERWGVVGEGGVRVIEFSTGR